MRAALVGAVAGVAAVAAGDCTSAADAATLGLSEQSAAFVRDRRVAAANLPVVRLIVPWDAALRPASGIEEWFAEAAKLPAEPLIAFERIPPDRCNGQTVCPAPTVAQLREAFAAFRERWPHVREFAAWNEPNHPWQPTADDPELAAKFHDALRRDCPACTIVAGELVDSASMKSYFTAYRAALRETPQVWGIHNYGDLIYDRPSYVNWLLARTAEPIWLTETGGIVSLRSIVDGSVQLPASETRATASMQRLLDLLAAEPARIQRAYAYHWREAPGAAFDAGLTRADGSMRPAGELFLAAAGPRPAKPDSPGAQQPATGGQSGGGPTSGTPPLVGTGGHGDSTDDRHHTVLRAPDTAVSGSGRTDRDRAAGPDGSEAAGKLAAAARGAHIADAASGDGPRLGTPARRASAWVVPARCPRVRTRGCTARIVLTAPRRTRGGTTVVGRRTVHLRDARWHRIRIATAPLVQRAPTAGAIAVTNPVHVSARAWATQEIR